MIRAKFRCMEINLSWNGKSALVRFLPVMAKSPRFPDDKDVSEENAYFWDATPSGEAHIRFFETLDSSKVPFELGNCYYIDMEPSEAGEWVLRSRAHFESQLDVLLERGWHDKVALNIHNQGAWDAFRGSPGERWSVVFSPAGP